MFLWIQTPLRKSSQQRRQFQGGQIVIEYMLLLIIAVAISAILVRGLANRTEGQEGIVVKRWQAIQQEIGNELPDKCSADQCAQ